MTDRPRADRPRVPRPRADTQRRLTRPVRPRRWWTDRHIVVVAYALLVTAVWTVWALGLLGGSTQGRFAHADEPVYPGSVDSWGCHWTDHCRSGTRRPDDPAPIATGPPAGTPVQIECRFGAYDKVHVGDVEGWVRHRAITAAGRPRGCSALQWW